MNVPAPNVRPLGPPTLMTSQEVCKGFDIAVMTLVNWRRYKELPYLTLHSGKRDAVRFDLPEILEWAAAHGYPFKVPARLHPFH